MGEGMKIILNIQEGEKVKFWGKFIFCLDSMSFAEVPPSGHLLSPTQKAPFNIA